MENFIKHLNDNKIAYDLIDIVKVKICDKTYEHVVPTRGLLFDEDLCLIAEDTDCDCYAFSFGGDYYYIDKEAKKKPIFKEMRYLGQSTCELKSDTFLGVHGGYEILNGSRQYEDWCAKAKFLGVKNLGIVEKNTLAGTLKFQIECLKSGIKPILGATYTVLRTKEDFRYDIKVFATNEIGWENILLMNKEVNVTNNKYIEESRLFELLEYVIPVIDPKSVPYSRMDELIDYCEYFQLDSVIYEDDLRDKEYLINLKKFVRQNVLKPVFMCDAYYLDADHYHIKKRLNGISGVRDFESKNQYFKDAQDWFEELDQIFNPEDDSFIAITQRAIQSSDKIAELCDFKIDTEHFNLPDYILTDEQRAQFENNEDLFWHLIEKGMQEKIPSSLYKKYMDRVEMEYSVIIQGHKLIDYFLILWDIQNYCERNDILVGWGRGSSGGSLVAYLLSITNIDPFEYGLLFERFLNENRVKKSIPDIDSDYPGNSRNQIKAYMEERFGHKHVCSVGTYGNLKLKMIFTDFARQASIPIQEVKVMTSILGEGEKDGTDWSEIFHLASKSQKLKDFIRRNPDIVHDAKLCLMQPRSTSVHACATIVTPNSKDIFRWFPVKMVQSKDKEGESMLISEWEGIELDKAGFLKEDILGIAQLDKFTDIIELIKQNRKIKIDFKRIPLDDKTTYQYFAKGWNSDVFQFGTQGLKKYTKELKPDSMEELMATNALFRPGAMKSNAHNDFVMIKFGKKEAEYDYMLEGITKKTYGLYIYQEQTMLAAKELGGFTLVEADMMRKVMLGRGKKQFRDQFYIYHDKFVEGAVKNGCDKDEAEKIWLKLEAFAGYGFNASHAAAYAITGYISQWFKVNYPIEFWTVAFKYAKEELLSSFISEIHATGAIKISPPDINESQLEMTSNYKTNTIYWAISSIKNVGDIASSQIMADRDANGPYFSLDEFLSRHSYTGSKVNKTHIENLIYSGAFDKIENIEFSAQRKRLIDQFRSSKKMKIDLEKDKMSMAGDAIYEDYFWDLRQKQLSGLAFFDYRTLCDKYLDNADYKYIEQDNFQDDDLPNVYYGTGGIINEVIIRETKKKGKYCSMIIESNNEPLRVTIFPDQYQLLTSAGFDFVASEGLLLILSGMLKYDEYHKQNIMKVWDKSKVVILS
jgi:DNA polymerase-3 subunit alpha